MKLAEHILKRAGTIALGMIEENISRGVDINGKQYSYSRKPFYMPYSKKIIRHLDGKSGEGKLYKTIKGKSGKLGMIILGGYAQFKEKVYPDFANDYLQATGKMLRNLKIIGYTETGVVLGWSDPVQAQKAYYLNVSGVGKSRKLWKFLGLSIEQQQKLSQKLLPLVSKSVADKLVASLTKL